jgi:hypothetical protein|tara:strand:- start:711 stop:1283 length:573 start_codon:yes stop_codon:yes gene_type:complete
MALVSQVHAKFIFFGWGDEKIVKVMDYPNTDDFYIEKDYLNEVFKGYDITFDSFRYLDLGYRMQQITIFFIPIWNYNGKWCGYIGSDSYYLTTLDFDFISSAYGLSIPNKPKLPFWDEYGGKLLLGAILALYIYFSYFRKDDDDLEVVENDKSEDSNNDDNIEKIEKLAKLKEQGHLTEEEYNKKKKELL